MRIATVIGRKFGRVFGFRMGVAALAFAGLMAPSAKADMTFVLPSGSTAGSLPVDATATFSISAGVVHITLTNLLANPTGDIQTINGIQFVLSSGQTTGTLTSSSAIHRTIASNGTFTDQGSSSTTWNLNSSVNDGAGAGIELTSIGNSGGAPTLIGLADSGNIYSAANGSIAGSKSHNPFLAGTATFDVNLSGLSASATINSVNFEFGTASGTNVAAVPAVVPEPSTIVMTALGLGTLGLIRLRQKATKA